jgi:hypothetical protein
LIRMLSVLLVVCLFDDIYTYNVCI